MSREDFTSPFRDGLKNSAFWGFFFSYKEKKLPWNTRFLRVPWQFFVWARSDNTGAVPMFSPRKKTKRKGVSCRNTTKSITLPCGRIIRQRDNTFGRGRPIWGKSNLAQGKRSQSGVSPWVYGFPPHYRALQGQGETLGIIGRDMAYDTQGAIHLAFARFICPGLGSSCPVGAFIGQSCVHAKLKYGTARKRTNCIKLSSTE